MVKIMELKKIQIKRISQLTGKQKQNIIDKYGQELYNNHAEQAAFVEVKTYEEIVPFCGKFSTRFREILKKDGLLGKIIFDNKDDQKTAKEPAPHIETIEFAEETRDMLEHRPDIKLTPELQKKLDNIKDGYLLLKKWKIDKGTEIIDIIELTDEYFEKII